MKNKKFFFPILIALVVFGFVLFKGIEYMLEIETQRLNALNAKNAKGSEHAEAGETTLTETKNGKRLWVIKTQKVDYDAKQAFSNMEKLTGEIFDPSEQVSFEFSADKGKYYKANSRLELLGNIKFSSPKGKFNLTAGSLNWQSGVDRMTASGGVVLNKGGKARSSAGSITFTQDLDYIELSGGAVTQMY